MAISKKRPQLLTTLEVNAVNTVITKIYDDINDLINSVNQSDTTESRKSFLGKSGDIRLAKTADGTYEIQGKTDEGWVKADMTYKTFKKEEHNGIFYSK